MISRTNIRNKKNKCFVTSYSLFPPKNILWAIVRGIQPNLLPGSVDITAAASIPPTPANIFFFSIGPHYYYYY